MPYVGKKPADIIATAVDTTTGTFSSNATVGGTLGVTGETTLSANLNLGDNDKAIFGAGSGDLEIYSDGTYSRIMETGGLFLVVDTNGSQISLTADNSKNMGSFIKDGAVQLFYSNAQKFSTTSSGIQVTGNIANTSGDFTLDVAGNILLDADDGNIHFKDGGTGFVSIINSSGDTVIQGGVQDKDIIFKGNDGGSVITALTLDMSAAGDATFNNNLYIPNYIYHDGDINTYIHFPADDNFQVVTAGYSRMKMVGSETSFNEDSASIDFRVESNDNANGLFVDASANQLGIGQTPSITGNGHYFHFGASGSENAHLVLVNTLDDGNGCNLFLNRQGSDGDLVNFRQANSLEGRIFVSGSTVTYAGFSGQHESSGIATNTAVGTVVSTIDELDTYPNTQSDTLGDDETHPKAGQTRADHPKVKISDSVGDACVYGVVAEFSKQDKVMIASVGIGSVRVTGACSKGDLLESNGDGTAKVQSDDVIRSKTIGKVTIGNSTTDVKLVSCVLYCG